jgi:hypothetical protein
MILALSVEEITFWQVTLGVGAVVIIVVVALLGLLLHLVRSIEISVGELHGAASDVAANTTDLKIALKVASTLEEVAVEAGRHANLLGVPAR